MIEAYYNEWDAFPAAWLRNLAAAGKITPGRVDERSIADVRAADVGGGRAHFFAGIAGWELALKLAGWPDDLPVWTGSCPCQPWSQAGEGKGVDDDRHLWPVWFQLIRERRPPVVFLEQVASKDGLLWLDIVQGDFQREGYAFGAVDWSAASVGAPHIRQRLWAVGIRGDVAHNARLRRRERRQEACGDGAGSSDNGGDSAMANGLLGGLRASFGAVREGESDFHRSSEALGMAHGDEAGRRVVGGERIPDLGQPPCGRHADGRREVGDSLADAECVGRDARRRAGSGEASSGRALGEPAGRGLDNGLVDAARLERERDARVGRQEGDRAEQRGNARVMGDSGGAGGGRDAGAVPGAQGEGERERLEPRGVADESQPAGATDQRVANADKPDPLDGGQQGGRRFVQPPTHTTARNPWADPAWIYCRDGKWRPTQQRYVEVVDGVSGRSQRVLTHLHPLTTGEKGRVGRLRAYGNAIVPQVAAEFIEMVMEYLGMESAR